uniref:Uncharacterized protein n=1 Tax=Brassica oleracea TaxID=3712 RepID=A0A3P6GCD1_BRAOL|nr:unnamed protein product [Brassica oleracea]
MGESRTARCSHEREDVTRCKSHELTVFVCVLVTCFRVCLSSHKMCLLVPQDASPYVSACVTICMC